MSRHDGLTASPQAPLAVTFRTIDPDAEGASNLKAGRSKYPWRLLNTYGWATPIDTITRD
jgi:hypothetical protein